MISQKEVGYTIGKINVAGRVIRLHGIFSKIEYAEAWVERAFKAGRPLRIVMGDDSKFWCVRPVDAEALFAAGYGLAR